MSSDLEQMVAEIQLEHRSTQSNVVSQGTLSAREVEVLRLLCAGQSHKQIARTLGISPRTADAHHWHISTKTGCLTGAQLGVWAVKNGIVQ